MFFSIVCAVYNVDKYFRRGIDSVLSQTFRDFELILVDDGSSDATPALCDEYAARDPRIRVIHQQNVGVGETRNRGMDLARGNYILFFDIDDILRPEALARLNEYLSENNPQLLIFSYREINPELGTEDVFKFSRLDISSNSELKTVYVDELSGLGFNNGFVWNKVYERDFLISNSLRSPNLRIQQDEVFNVEVLKRVDRILVISDVLYDYYVYNSGNNRSRHIPERLEIYRTVRDSLLSLSEHWRLNDPRFEAYIRRRFVDSLITYIDKNLGNSRADIRAVMEAADVRENLSRLSDLNARPIGALYGALYHGSARRYLVARRYDTCLKKIKSFGRKILTHFSAS